jgi:adenylyl-sulfate kinase
MPDGITIWFTGLSGAGKTTVASLIAASLREKGLRVEVLDGDVVRTNLSKGLGFSKEDRDTNIRRIGFVCELLSRNGVIAIAAAISPYRTVRDEVRARIPNFVEVFVDCPLETLIARDSKGLYRKALAGEIKEFSGISDPYEPPLRPEVVLRTAEEQPEESARKVWAALVDRRLIAPE